MDQRLRDIAETMARDGHSGASEMMVSTLSRLLSIPPDRFSTITASDWEEFAIALHRAKPTIATLFNIANAILLDLERGGHAAIRDTIKGMLQRESDSGQRITALASEPIAGDRIMTTSYSSTVAQVLTALAKVRDIRVTVAEAVPGGEGRQFARLLSKQGMKVEVIHDSTVFARMDAMDATVVGADSVTRWGLVNKVGTRAVAEAARACSIPSHAVCGWSKISPVVLSDLVVSEGVLEENLTEHVQVFESTPLDLFTDLITDQGVLSPAELARELQSNGAARAWYARGVLGPR